MIRSIEYHGKTINDHRCWRHICRATKNDNDHQRPTMNNNPPYRRKQLRLQGYDYTQTNAYFITVCTHQRVHHLGKINNGIMHCSAIGELTVSYWDAIPEHHRGVQLDEFIVMPNHIHGIIVLPGGGAALGTIVGTYKAAVSRQARRAMLNAPAAIWQSGYYDHIVRNERSLEHIRHYIRYNATKWERDRLQKP